MRAAKNPSSASMFMALPPLQLLRNSARRSSSASVSGSFWVNVLIAFLNVLGNGLRYHPRLAGGLPVRGTLLKLTPSARHFLGWQAAPNTAAAVGHCGPQYPTPSSARLARAAACPV